MATGKSSRLPATVNRILARGTSVPALYEQALRLIELQKQLRSLLPPPLGDHVTVGNCRNGILTVYADSAAWAARLRFEVPGLLNRLNETSPDAGIRTLRTRIRPPDPVAAPAAGKPLLSAASARLLQDVAESIDDPGLRESLLRLSRHR